MGHKENQSNTDPKENEFNTDHKEGHKARSGLKQEIFYLDPLTKEEFERKIIPEWRHAYLKSSMAEISLRPLEVIISSCEEILANEPGFKENNIPDIIKAADKEIQNKVLKMNDIFLRKFEEEKNKVDMFFKLKWLEIFKECYLLKANIVFILMERKNSQVKQGNPDINVQSAFSEIDQIVKAPDLKNSLSFKMLKFSIENYYKKVSQLIGYSEVNINGLMQLMDKRNKIVKTFPKKLGLNKFDESQVFSNLIINSSLKRLYCLRRELEKLYLSLFFLKFNRTNGLKALKRIVVPQRIPKAESYFLYFCLGCLFIIFIAVTALLANGEFDPDSDKNFAFIFPLFRGTGLLVVYMWLLVVNVYIWNEFGVNYAKIFGFKYHQSTLVKIIRRTSIFTCCFLIMLIWYTITERNITNLSKPLSFFPHEYEALVPWGLLIAYMLFPSRKYCNYYGRKYVFKVIMRTFLFCKYDVEFNMIWLTNQITSFSTAFRDFIYAMCFYSYKLSTSVNSDEIAKGKCFQNSFSIGYVTVAVPILFRVIQSFKMAKKSGKFFKHVQFINTLKFSLTLIVATLSFLYGRYKSDGLWYFWIVCAILGTIFTYSWDIKIGWGLLEPPLLKNKFLRETLWYKKRIYYRLAIIFNLLSRLTWILNISPAILGDVWRPEFFSTLIAFIEMLRRCVWNIFRVERDQVNNSSLFKSSEDLKLPHSCLESIPIDKPLLREYVHSLEKSLRIKCTDRKNSLIFEKALSEEKPTDGSPNKHKIGFEPQLDSNEESDTNIDTKPSGFETLQTNDIQSMADNYKQLKTEFLNLINEMRSKKIEEKELKKQIDSLAKEIKRTFFICNENIKKKSADCSLFTSQISDASESMKRLN